MTVINFFKNYSHIIVVGLICIALWGLNARNSQLTATNERLEKLADSKDSQIHQLRGENNKLASSITDFIAAVEQQNELLETVTAQREIANRENRELQNEIIRALENDKCAVAPVPADAVDRLRDAAKAAGGVPDDNAATPAGSGSAHQSDTVTGHP